MASHNQRVFRETIQVAPQGSLGITLLQVSPELARPAPAAIGRRWRLLYAWGGRCSHDSHGEEATRYFHMWLWPLSLEVDMEFQWISWPGNCSISILKADISLDYLDFSTGWSTCGSCGFRSKATMAAQVGVWLLLDWMAILGDNDLFVASPFSSCQLLTTMHSTLDEPHRNEFLQAMSCAGSGWKQVVLRGFRQGLSVGATW